MSQVSDEQGPQDPTSPSETAGAQSALDPALAIELRSFSTRDVFRGFVAGQRSQVDKDDLVVAACTGKTVLDIGCIDHDIDTVDQLDEAWLHARLKGVASSLVGLDILEAEAALLNARGFNIVTGDAHDFDLGQTFDVVVVGDIIEHMTNPGLLLDSAAHHMTEQSICIVTTPNPFNIEQVFSAVTRNVVSVNPEHTLWLDPRVTWELVSRSPLQIVDFFWTSTRFSFVRSTGFRGRLVQNFCNHVMARRPICRTDFAVVLALDPSRPSEQR